MDFYDNKIFFKINNILTNLIIELSTFIERLDDGGVRNGKAVDFSRPTREVVLIPSNFKNFFSKFSEI